MNHALAIRLPNLYRVERRRQFVVGGVVWDNYTHDELRRQPLFRVLLPIYLVLTGIYMAVFTQAGQDWVVDKVQDVAPLSNAKMQYVAWGTGSTAENVSNTALHVEASEARVLGTLTQPSADVDRLTGTMTCAGATKTITESGRFNASTGNTMQQRALFTGLEMQVGDAIIFDHDLQAT